MRVVVFGHNDWWVWSRQGFCTRNAALFRELATRSEVDESLVVDSPRFLTRTHRPRERRREPTSRVADRIVAVRYRYALPLPAAWHPGLRANQRLAEGGLRRRLSEPEVRRVPTVVWVADPRLVRPALSIPHDLFVFDAIDDWREHAWAGRRNVEDGYRLAADRAHVVFAVHPRMLAILEPRGHAEVLYNAVNSEPWMMAGGCIALTATSRPVVGYVGKIQHRLDARLVANVAALLPEASILLVGQVSSDYRRELRSMPPNVSLLGPRSYADLPALVSSMDVCIVPHVRDGLTASMDPLKIYEYLAAGKPVVSTVPAPNPSLAGLVRVATDAESFAASVRASWLGDSVADRAARRTAVAGENWAVRVDRVLCVLQAALEGGQGRFA